MNRLLLRSFPTLIDQFRIDIHFQFVQAIHLPVLDFEGLEISDETGAPHTPFLDTLVEYPECRIFRLTSNKNVGWIVAAGCAYDMCIIEGGAPSNFPMMT
jgi:hypothetical protein